MLSKVDILLFVFLLAWAILIDVDVERTEIDMRSIASKETIGDGPGWQNILPNRFFSTTRFHVLCTYYSDLDQRWTERPYRTYYNRLYLPTDVGGFINVDGTEYTLQRGKLYLIPSGVMLGIRAVAPFGKHWCHFLAEADNGFDLFELLSVPVEVDIGDFSDAERLYKKMEDSMDCCRSGWMNIQRTTWLLELLIPFLQNEAVVGVNPGKQAFLPVLQHIKNHIAEPIRLEDLAGLMLYSSEHFLRHFKKVFGITPMNYVRLKRIQLAQRMLCMSSFSLKEIAARCGFSSASRFSKSFKMVTDRSPSEFRAIFERNRPPGVEEPVDA